MAAYSRLTLSQRTGQPRLQTRLQEPTRRAPQPEAPYSSLLARCCAPPRPQQWVKNSLVFAGVIFSQQLTDATAVRSSVLTFGLFVLASGGIYLVNDILDRDADRVHPLKRQRPLAAGELPRSVALAAAIVLLGSALVGAFLMQLALGAILGLYVVMNLAYSAWLKHVVLLDVFLIASGFLLRAAAGVVAVLTPHFTVALPLHAAGGTPDHPGQAPQRNWRCSAHGRPTHRRNLGRYTAASLDRWLTGVAATTIVAYVLYTLFSPATFGNPILIVTVPFVAFGLLRYLRIARAPGGAESPEVLLLPRPVATHQRGALGRHRAGAAVLCLELCRDLASPSSVARE